MPGEYPFAARRASAPRFADFQPRPRLRANCDTGPADRRANSALRLESSSPAYGNQLHHRIAADPFSLLTGVFDKSFSGRYSMPPPIGTSTN